MLSYNSYNPSDKERDFVGKLLNIEPNDISYKFFSDINVDYINNTLINMVMEETYKRYNKKAAIYIAAFFIAPNENCKFAACHSTLSNINF